MWVLNIDLTLDLETIFWDRALIQVSWCVLLHPLIQ